MSSEREMARSLGAGVGKVIFHSGQRLQSPGGLGNEAGGTTRADQGCPWVCHVGLLSSFPT